MRTLALSVFLALTACGGKTPVAITAPTPAATSADATAIAAKLEEAQGMWAARSDASKLHATLLAYEEVLAMDPANRTALQRLTRGWYLYGDAHADEKETKIERWGKAIEYGATCLALNPDIAERIQQGERERDAVASATIADVPCLYWSASAIGKWGKIQGLSKTLKNLPTVKAYIGRAEELNATFYHYGPARYWGSYYAVLPSFAGQDLDRSAEYFTASIEGAPDYLGTRVLRATYLAVATENVAMFDEDIRFVLDAPEGIGGPVAQENTLEKIKAQNLLDQRSELFSRSAIEAAAGGME